MNWKNFTMSKEIIVIGEAIDKLNKWDQYKYYDDGSGLLKFEKLLQTLG
jgi:hypothetical protein